MSFHFSPKQFIDYVCQANDASRNQFGIAETVVITWFDHVFHRLTTASEAVVPAQRLLGEKLKTGRLADTPVTIVHSPIGAPGTISLMEELIELGAKKIVGFGYAGSLQSKAPIGSLIVPTHCVSDEGTSQHYLTQGERGLSPSPSSADSRSDARIESGHGTGDKAVQDSSVLKTGVLDAGASETRALETEVLKTEVLKTGSGTERALARVEDAWGDEPMRSMIVQASKSRGLEVHTGQHWTTDAIYRESTSRIEELQAQGVLGVDMETSAMYAVGFVRNVRVCNALVVSDELFHEWNPGFKGDVLRSSKENLEDALLDVLPLL